MLLCFPSIEQKVGMEEKILEASSTSANASVGEERCVAAVTQPSSPVPTQSDYRILFGWGWELMFDMLQRVEFEEIIPFFLIPAIVELAQGLFITIFENPQFVRLYNIEKQRHYQAGYSICFIMSMQLFLSDHELNVPHLYQFVFNMNDIRTKQKAFVFKELYWTLFHTFCHSGFGNVTALLLLYEDTYSGSVENKNGWNYENIINCIYENITKYTGKPTITLKKSSTFDVNILYHFHENEINHF